MTGALNAALLFRARGHIRSKRKTPLTTSLGFLHREFQIDYFWWELMEMGRRFLLVGLYVIEPFPQGSIMQVGLAALTSILFLTIQLQTMLQQQKSSSALRTGAST